MGIKNCVKEYLCLFFLIIPLIFKCGLGSGLGRCPKYPPLAEYDIEKITGQWFEVERSFYFMEITASCTTMNLTLSSKGNLLVEVYSVNRWTGNPTVSYGMAIPTVNGSSIFRYKLNNRLPLAISRMLPGAGLYNILYTDYDNIAVLWSCSSIGIAYADQVWVFGRSTDITAEMRAPVYRLLDQLNIDPDRLIISNNNNCTAYFK